MIEQLLDGLKLETNAEYKFKQAVRGLIRQGIYPAPTEINIVLGRDRHQMNSLSGRECRWRREVPEFREMQARRKRGQ